MDKKRFSLEYSPTPADLSGNTDRYRTHLARGPYLTVSRDGYAVHGNSYVAVKVNGEDVSSDYATWRQWRIWRLRSDESLNPSGRPEQEWTDDNTPNDNGKRRANWMDAPGFEMIGDPDHWPDQRRLIEFVVSVDGHTDESGALYFYIIVSTKPGKYRLQMSSAVNVPFQKWRDIAATRQPWAAASGCAVKIDSLWRSPSD